MEVLRFSPAPVFGVPKRSSVQASVGFIFAQCSWVSGPVLRRQ